MFEPVAGMDGVYTAVKGKLRCVAIRLLSGDLCLYSPVAGLEEDAHKLGTIAYLLAPNQYHNKGIAGHAARFPKAKLIAPQACCARLEKVTGQVFASLEDAPLDMPVGMRLVTPGGLKTGEVWLVTADGLVVVDAFAGAAKDGDAPALLKTFPRYGIANIQVYAAWVAAFMTQEKPIVLVPCHGGIMRSPTLSDRLTAIVASLT